MFTLYVMISLHFDFNISLSSGLRAESFIQLAYADIVEEMIMACVRAHSKITSSYGIMPYRVSQTDFPQGCQRELNTLEFPNRV